MGLPHDLAERAAALIRSQRHLFVSLLVVIAVLVWGAVGASAWWIKDVVSGLPSARDVRGNRRYGSGDDALRRPRPDGVHDL